MIKISYFIRVFKSYPQSFVDNSMITTYFKNKVGKTHSKIQAKTKLLTLIVDNF